MISAIIVILVIVLLSLFVDWGKLSRRIPRKPGRAGRGEPREFNFDPQDQAGVASGTSFAEPNQSMPASEPERPASAIPEVEKLIEEADVHFRKGEMKAAEDAYLQAASKDPRCSRAYSRLGVIYLEQADSYQDAEEALRQALKTDPQNGYVLNNLGLALYHQDKYADAIRQFEMAVRQDELNAARHANLGMAYLAMRQYAKAESSFKKALKLSPQEMEYKDLLTESIEKKKAHKSMVRR